MEKISKKPRFKDQVLTALIEIRGWLGHGDYKEVASQYMDTKEGKEWQKKRTRVDSRRAVEEKVRRVGRGETHDVAILQLLKKRAEENKELIEI